MPGGAASVDVCSGVARAVGSPRPRRRRRRSRRRPSPRAGARPRRPRPPVDDEADHDDEAGVAQDEVAGAVDRIDHPDPATSEARAVSGISSDRMTSSGKAAERRSTISVLAALIGLGDRLVAGLAVDVAGACRGSRAPARPPRARSWRRSPARAAKSLIGAPPLARSRASAARPASSTRPARTGSVTVDQHRQLQARSDRRRHRSASATPRRRAGESPSC